MDSFKKVLKDLKQQDYYLASLIEDLHMDKCFYDDHDNYIFDYRTLDEIEFVRKKICGIIKRFEKLLEDEE